MNKFYVNEIQRKKKLVEINETNNTPSRLIIVSHTIMILGLAIIFGLVLTMCQGVPA